MIRRRVLSKSKRTRRKQPRGLRAKLDAVYSGVDSRLDLALEAMQAVRDLKPMKNTAISATRRTGERKAGKPIGSHPD